jgi:hypothetical protein
MSCRICTRAVCCRLFSKPKNLSTPGISILDGTPGQSSSLPLLALLALLIVEFFSTLSTTKSSHHLSLFHAVPAASLNQFVPIPEDHLALFLPFTPGIRILSSTVLAGLCWMLLSCCLGIHSIAHQRRCPNTL